MVLLIVKALSENNDIEASVKWLREKGILKAQNKIGNNEGVVSFYNISSNVFTVCKENETDFVAKTTIFRFCLVSFKSYS